MVIMNSKSSEPLCKAVINLSHKGRTPVERGISKPEPNILRIFQLFLPELLKKFTRYSYFILLSLPIIPLLYFCVNVLGTYIDI